MSIIIYPPTLDWTWMKQRPQHMLQRLAAVGHTVLYCNRTHAKSAVEEVAPNLFVVHNHDHWLRHDWPRFRKRRRQRVGVWCNLPFQHAAIRNDYAPDWIVYDCADDYIEWSAHERELVAAANVVICSSQRLYDRMVRSYPGRRIALIRNGYDPDMNLHAAGSRVSGDNIDAAAAGPRRLGYVGAWAPWIDVRLIGELTAIRDVEIVIVGPEFGRKYGPPDASGRFRFLGLKRHDQLSDWIRSFSVCLIPFRIIPATLSVNPIKAYEYLAAGLPVVSTALPECGAMMPHVDVAPTRRDFVRTVAMRLEQPGDAAARVRFALANTWDRRGEEAAALLAPLDRA